MTFLRRLGAAALPAAILVAGCVGPGGGQNPEPAAANAASAGATASAIQAATPLPGIGTSRAAVIAAVDAVLGAGKIAWKPERLMSDGTPIVEGGAPLGQVFRQRARLAGPAGNLTFIEIGDDPATSVEQAGLALAVLRVSVPAAEDWFRKSFSEAPTFERETFGTLTVGWARDIAYNDGEWSILIVSAVPLGPGTSPLPNPSAPPIPPPSPTPTDAPVARGDAGLCAVMADLDRGYLQLMTVVAAIIGDEPDDAARAGRAAAAIGVTSQTALATPRPAGLERLTSLLEAFAVDIGMAASAVEDLTSSLSRDEMLQAIGPSIGAVSTTRADARDEIARLEAAGRISCP